MNYLVLKAFHLIFVVCWFAGLFYLGRLFIYFKEAELKKNSEERKVIIPAIKKLKKQKISVEGPLSGDTAFLNFKKNKFDVLVGMYHDQVLSPFKTLYRFDAVNVTLGLPYIRVSPDHGTGKDIIRKNLANPKSLLQSIKFFKNINVRT